MWVSRGAWSPSETRPWGCARDARAGPGTCRIRSGRGGPGRERGTRKDAKGVIRQSCGRKRGQRTRKGSFVNLGGRERGHSSILTHVWQGRFKAFPIQDADHLRVVLRYIERN